MWSLQLKMQMLKKILACTYIEISLNTEIHQITCVKTVFLISLHVSVQHG